MTSNGDMMISLWTKVFGFSKAVGKDTVLTSWELLKITVPVIIITKILEELGLIVYLSGALAPVMELVGLPGTFGLVWATAMLTNIYGAMVVFATVVQGTDVTAAQATTLCSMILIAHSLPLELSISKKAGAPFLPIAFLRISGAMVYGYLLHLLCSWLHIWEEKATIIFSASKQMETIFQWLVAQAQNLGIIVVVIFCILIVMRILSILGVLDFLSGLLEPLLPPFGMSRRAAPVTVVGMVLGISYGGALIIRETTSGKLDRREVFFSLALMGLSHALIEDTLLMLALGGKINGILWGRLAFSLCVIFILAKVCKKPVSGD